MRNNAPNRSIGRVQGAFFPSEGAFKIVREIAGMSQGTGEG